MGRARSPHFTGFEQSKMSFLITKKIKMEINPLINGDMNHDITIEPKNCVIK